MIRTPEELDALVVQLAGVRALAIDTEADSLHRYSEKVCLVQLAAPGGAAWLVDPLALGAARMRALARVMEDPAVLKVFHSGDNDVTSLRRDFGWSFRSLFDTSIAARLLGDTELGLAAIVRRELGVELKKGNQRDDWSARPLSPAQQAYAIADVAHLLELAARFTGRLAAAGRTAWAREEFEALAALPPSQRRDARAPDAHLDLKGASLLPPRALAVLRELHLWREAQAEAADRPPFKIIAAEAVVALARAAPTSLDEVARALRGHPRVRGQAAVVHAAIARALAIPEAELPGRARGGKRPSFDAGERQRIEALRAWRSEKAAQLGVEPSVVLPQKLIERIAEAAPRTPEELAAVEGLRRWRVAEWGAEILKLTAQE